MKKEIAVGIALVGIICIALFSGCIQETPKTEYIPPTPTPTLDIRDIVVTAEDLNYDLWINEQGESSPAQTRYITIKNNGGSKSYIRVSCVGEDLLEDVYHIGVGGAIEISLEPYTSQLVGIFAYSYARMGAEETNSIPGEYDFVKVRVELIKVSYVDGEYTRDYTTIAEFPMHIKVNDIRD